MPIEIRKDGDKLVISCELTKGTLSSSGKSLVVSTTNGFVPVEGTDLKVSLNVIKPSH